MNKQRSRWTQKEDSLLEAAVKHKGSSSEPDWNDVAKLVPGRTSSDCLKRWRQRSQSANNTGTWSTTEDDRLRQAVFKHGLKWVTVAEQVRTRNGEQCAKRWNENLDPTLNHSPWSAEEDELLLSMVALHGKNWKTIASVAFEARAALALKNRYSLLMRRHKRESTQSSIASLRHIAASTAHQLQGMDFSFVSASQIGSEISTPASSCGNMGSYDMPMTDAALVIPMPVGTPFDIAAHPTTGFEHLDFSNQTHFAWNNNLTWPDPGLSGFQPDTPNSFSMGADTGPDNVSDFSITCARSKLSALVREIVDVAVCQQGNIAADDDVTVTLRFRSMI